MLEHLHADSVGASARNTIENKMWTLGRGSTDPDHIEGGTMAYLDEEEMAEIAESLRVLGEAELRWARLVDKLRLRSPIPPTVDGLGCTQRSAGNANPLHDAR